MPVEIHASSLLHCFSSLLLPNPPSPNRPPFLNNLCGTKTLSELYYEDKFSFKRIIQLYEEFWMKWHWQTITMHPLKRSYLKYPLSSISMKISTKISIIFPMLGRIIESKYLFRFSSLLLHLRKKNQNKIKSCKMSWIFFKMSIEYLYKQN